MFSNLTGLGGAYSKLPPHHNFAELVANIEKLADYLLDRGAGSFGREAYLKASGRWEWKLGQDLKMLIEYAKDFVPPQADGLHHFSGRGKRESPK